MHILDDLEKIKKMDPRNVAGSINHFADQLEQAYNEASLVEIPSSYKKVQNIVVSGMGGSAYCGRVLEAVFGGALKIPITTINSYNLPGWVDHHTLFVASSYSGATEETIASFRAALLKKAKVIVLTSGQPLAGLMRQYKVPGYFFKPLNNPCGQPRIGLGYTIMGLLNLLNKIGCISLTKGEVNKYIVVIRNMNKKFNIKTKFGGNEAKKLAAALHKRRILYIAAEHLSANAQIFAYQTNESAKTMAHYHLIPELNHHLMEGLRFPLSNKNNLACFFLDSNLYSQKIQKRFAVTKKVVAKNNVPFFSLKTSGANPLEQVLATMAFSGWLTYYLGILNGIDPVKIPWVDYFKAQLDKSGKN